MKDIKIGKDTIIRRTFEAKKYPGGSFKRNQLNGRIKTSEYSLSRKYAILGPGSIDLFCTREEAIDYYCKNCCKLKYNRIHYDCESCPIKNQ